MCFVRGGKQCRNNNIDLLCKTKTKGCVDEETAKIPDNLPQKMVSYQLQ